MILVFSIFVSTIIAMIQNISFTLFFKRTVVLLLLTFVSSKICIRSIIKTKELTTNGGEIDQVIPYDKLELEMDTKQAEDDFTPLDADELKTKTDAKVIGKTN